MERSLNEQGNTQNNKDPERGAASDACKSHMARMDIAFCILFLSKVCILNCRKGLET